MRSMSSLIPWLLLTVTAVAQEGYRWEQIDELGVKYQVFRKLERIPLTFGDKEPHKKAQYEPGGEGDRINGARGSFPWGLAVFSFPKTAGGESKKEESKDAREALASAAEAKRRAANFKDFVTSSTKDQRNHNRKFQVKDKVVPGKGKKIGYSLWEYSDAQPMTNGIESFDQVYYSMAAVYDFPEREIALICEVPLKKDAVKPEPKHLDWMKTMILSLTSMKESEVGEVEADANKDRYADTEKKRTTLAAAKENIRNLNHWGYFTSPRYICLYSWDAKKADNPEKQRDASTKAKLVVENLERMNLLYEKVYPPHEKMDDYYSVVRVCADYDDYRKYGGPPSTAGYFSPQTKELVFFLGGEKVGFGDKGFTLAVGYHEGWHQYCDRYFVLPINASLQSWFNEGTGEYFGSYSWTGTTWTYEPNKIRKPGIKQQVRENTWVPWKEIVNWGQDKFYSGKTGDHYEQGFAMVDFLRNGSKNKSDWDSAWDKIMPAFDKTLLETKDPKKAIEEAFKGVDWDKIEASWVKWVKAY